MINDYAELAKARARKARCPGARRVLLSPKGFVEPTALTKHVRNAPN